MNMHSFSELHRRLGPRVSWYSLAVIALGVVFVVLCVELSVGFLVDRAEHHASVAAKRARLQAIADEVTPLRGLGKDIGETRNSIAQFYSDRVPASYSQIISSLGEIAIRAGVSLSQVSYAQGAPGSDLSQVSMEVSVAGDYSQLIHFVTGIERDRNFFIVRALSFTGQQGGDVVLHVRISTWLRSRAATEPLISSARVTAMAKGGK
jgi:Tfp pilus assembly protein PilO